MSPSILFSADEDSVRKRKPKLESLSECSNNATEAVLSISLKVGQKIGFQNSKALASHSSIARTTICRRLPIFHNLMDATVSQMTRRAQIQEKA